MAKNDDENSLFSSSIELEMKTTSNTFPSLAMIGHDLHALITNVWGMMYECCDAIRSNLRVFSFSFIFVGLTNNDPIHILPLGDIV